MSWQLLLGILIGLVTGIVANLLTPGVPALWRAFRRWQHASYHSQLRQQIKVAQTSLEQHVRLTTGPTKDFFLYLFSWLLGIFAVFILAMACAFLSLTPITTTEPVRANLRLFTLICLILAAMMSVIILNYCRHLTDAGMEKHRKHLEHEVEKLVSKLPHA